MKCISENSENFVFYIIMKYTAFIEKYFSFMPRKIDSSVTYNIMQVWCLIYIYSLDIQGVPDLNLTGLNSNW